MYCHWTCSSIHNVQGHTSATRNQRASHQSSPTPPWQASPEGAEFATPFGDIHQSPPPAHGMRSLEAGPVNLVTGRFRREPAVCVFGGSAIIDHAVDFTSNRHCNAIRINESHRSLAGACGDEGQTRCRIASVSTQDPSLPFQGPHGLWSDLRTI